MASNHPQAWRLSVVADRIEHMIETLAGPGAGEVEDLTARDLLASIRPRALLEDAAAARQLVLAAQWADLHPPESIHSAATFTVPGCEHEEPIAGEGAPLVAEFCLAELGAVLGVSTIAAKKLVGHALELRHRLPRLWAQVQAGRVPAWRARSVAEATIHTTPALTREAAAFVDAQVAAVAGRVGPAQLDRLVAEAIKRFDLAEVDPAADPEDGYLLVDPRHVTIHDDDVHFAGTMRLEAELDIADALDLDRALAHGAATLKALGSERVAGRAPRPQALGDLARTQTALDLAGAGRRCATTCPPPARSSSTPTSTPRSTGCATVFGPTGRMEEGQRLVLLDQVKDWCADSRTKITVKPVIDLNAQLSTPALRGPRPDPRAGDPPRPHVRVPVVHPTGPRLRRRPRRRVRPRRRGRGPTPARSHPDRQPRRALPVPPPPQDPHRLALPDDRARGLRVDHTARPPLPTRPHRHHPDRPRPPDPPDIPRPRRP